MVTADHMIRDRCDMKHVTTDIYDIYLESEYGGHDLMFTLTLMICSNKQAKAILGQHIPISTVHNDVDICRQPARQHNTSSLQCVIGHHIL